MAKAQVLRCSVCSVKVAYEEDLVKSYRASGRGGISASFTTVFNVRASSNNGTLDCTRCGNAHFALTELHPKADLVLTLGEKRVFERTPLKVLTVTKANATYFYNHLREKKDPSERPERGPWNPYRFSHTFDQSSRGVRALQDILSLEDLTDRVEVQQRNVVWLYSQASKHRRVQLVQELPEHLERGCPQLDNKIEAYLSAFDFAYLRDKVFDQTYDLVVVTQIGNESGGFLAFSGYFARTMEELLVLSWASAGGNVLIGQWGIPNGAERYGIGDQVDHRAVGEMFESAEGSRNVQETLAHFMKEGQFLSWWKIEDPLPNYVKVRIRSALNGATFGDWRFLEELPKAAFDVSLEKVDGYAIRSVEVKDKFMPSLDDKTMQVDPKSDETNPNGILPKSSRELFATGLAFFHALVIERDLEKARQEEMRKKRRPVL